MSAVTSLEACGFNSVRLSDFGVHFEELCSSSSIKKHLRKATLGGFRVPLHDLSLFLGLQFSLNKRFHRVSLTLAQKINSRLPVEIPRETLLTRAKDPLIEILPECSLECPAFPCRVGQPESACLPALSHVYRLLDTGDPAIQFHVVLGFLHGRKPGFQARLIQSDPVVEAGVPLIGGVEKQPPRRVQGELAWSSMGKFPVNGGSNRVRRSEENVSARRSSQ